MAVEYCKTFEVWSSGLEEWEAVELSGRDLFDLRYEHTKSVNGVLHDFYKDSLNRWLRQPKQ
jgi:hypothetical protein